MRMRMHIRMCMQVAAPAQLKQRRELRNEVLATIEPTSPGLCLSHMLTSPGPYLSLGSKPSSPEQPLN